MDETDFLSNMILNWIEKCQWICWFVQVVFSVFLSLVTFSSKFYPYQKSLLLLLVVLVLLVLAQLMTLFLTAKTFLGDVDISGTQASNWETCITPPPVKFLSVAFLQWWEFLLKKQVCVLPAVCTGLSPTSFRLFLPHAEQQVWLLGCSSRHYYSSPCPLPLLHLDPFFRVFNSSLSSLNGSGRRRCSIFFSC